jgi:hypothetical protein
VFDPVTGDCLNVTSPCEGITIPKEPIWIDNPSVLSIVASPTHKTT